MVDPWLWKALIAPLGVGAIALIALHFLVPLGGLWINLSASLITIILTVLYVDRILKHQEATRWASATKLVSGRLSLLAATTITNIRGALNLPAPQIMVATDNEVQQEYLYYCRVGIEPAVLDSVQGLDIEGWKEVSKAIRASYGNAENALALLSARLDPRELELLMDLQNHLRTALLSYETFPDLLGVPDHLLPKIKTDPKFLRDHHVKWAASEIQAALKNCRELGEHELDKGRAAA